MPLPKPKFQFSLLFLSLVSLFGATLRAQEKPNPPDRSAAATAKAFPAAKSQAPAAEPTDAEKQSPSGIQREEDSADQIRKRAEWFYKQRSSVSGHIPAGARLRAFQHMQRMMLAEGKLVLRPDGSYAEVAPQSWLSPLGAVTSPWISIGPTPTTGGFFSPVTGRVMTIAVDPSDATGNTVLLGGAMGGIWRSMDAGQTWTAVGDQNASLAMGSIAFAPSNSSVVYAGTGEQALAFDTYYGAGVLKSSDHGQTWTQTCTVPSLTCPFIGPYTDGSEFGPGFGFLNFGGAHISYVAVNPSNPNMVLVGAQFIEEGPKEGVYCSNDGGSTWSNILPDEMATFIGFASSSVAYAAFGNPAGSSPGAPHGNGIYKATGIGSMCSTISFLLLTAPTLPPQSTMGRIDLGIAPSDTSGNTVYASIADATTGSAADLGVFVTTNGGTSWTLTSAPDVCQFQCWYDNVVKVDPNNPSIAFFGGSAVRDSSKNPSWVVRTENGGTSWSSVIPNLPGGSAGLPHVDNHAMAFFKATSGTFSGKVRMYLGNDGGVWRSDDAEASSVIWTNLNNPSLTLTQFYPSISINPSAPSIAFGGTQDNDSQNYQGGTSWMDNQLCGDGASSAVDFSVPSTVYIGCATGAPVNVSYQNGAIGTFSPAINGINLSDFASFIPPLVADPNAADVAYFGTTKIYQSVDAGNTWVPISFDLANGSSWLNTIAVAPGNSSVVYTGLNNGQIFFANNVAAGLTASFTAVNHGLPPRSVTAIAVDPSDPTGSTAYASFSAFSFVGNDPFGNAVNDPTGHIFKTTNNGNTWTDVSCSTTNCSAPAATDLPNIPVSDLVLDPDLPGTLYAATDLGVFVTNCSATPCTWSTLSTGLPRAAALSLRLYEPSRMLRAATHGRGAWDIFLNNFSFTGPRIFSLSPTSANPGGAITLTVNGTGLTNGAVQWNGASANVTTTQVSDTQLTAQVGAALLVGGTAKITVLVGTSTSNSLTFSVLASTPTLSSITPSSTPVQTPPSPPLANIPIQLTGTNFAASAKVLFNGAYNGITVAAPTASCPLPTCLSATLPSALLGPYGSTNSISVVNLPPGGGQSKPVNFQVVAPPPPNDNFANATNIASLSFLDVRDSSGATTEATDPTPPCAHQYTAAQGNTGGHPNGVYNTIWYKFTPIFSANLNVDTINSNYDTVLSIWTGSPGSLVNVACNDDIVPGINIQSQLSSVPLTTGTTYYIMVSSFGPPDPNPVALGGRSQLNFSYNNGLNPTPVVTSISPTTANSGDPAFTLTINGSQFLPGATATFAETPIGASTQLTTNVVSSTQITASVPASAILFPGPYEVTVANPAPSSGPSYPTNFTVNVGKYPTPTLNSISPTSVVAGGLFPITLNAQGTQFASNATLNFGATPFPVQYDPFSNHTSVSAAIPVSAMTAAATVQVNVANPTPGGGPSNSLSFTITAPNPLPTITSLSPASVQSGSSGGNATITVTGTGLLSGAMGCLNYPSGISCQPAANVSSTRLSANINSYLVPGTYAFYVVDPSPGGTSAAANLTITATTDFSINAIGFITQTVTAGQTATFSNSISIGQVNGYTSTVNLTCSLSAPGTTCAVSPASFPTSSGSATVTVTTTAHSLAPPQAPVTPRVYLRPERLLLLSLAALLALFLLLFARTRRQRLASALPLGAVALFLLLHAAGCGGGSGSGGGTPAGTYTITVTATSGSTQHQATLTLFVN